MKLIHRGFPIVLLKFLWTSTLLNRNHMWSFKRFSSQLGRGRFKKSKEMFGKHSEQLSPLKLTLRVKGSSWYTHKNIARKRHVHVYVLRRIGEWGELVLGVHTPSLNLSALIANSFLRKVLLDGSKVRVRMCFHTWSPYQIIDYTLTWVLSYISPCPLNRGVRKDR
jgi:hypothetical protein